MKKLILVPIVIILILVGINMPHRQVGNTREIEGRIKASYITWNYVVFSTDDGNIWEADDYAIDFIKGDRIKVTFDDMNTPDDVTDDVVMEIELIEE